MGLDVSRIRETIAAGKAVLGIELGSTRIKAVLVDETNAPIASGAHDWENQLVDGIWTYSLDAIWTGLQDSYAKLAEDVKKTYDVELTNLAAIGFSAMMHGYMPFDKDGKLLVPFRTWRNTITEEASDVLSEKFNFHIPQRWTIAHLYQAILNGEEHVKDIVFVSTLAEYLHWQLTGEKVAGVGEASGMFPIDTATKDYNEQMVQKFDELVAPKGFGWKLRDVSGKLQAGIPLCPPEGDAGTGMAATNSVAVRTGNVSAGTSVFGMIVLEKDLSKPYEAIDIVTTPAGHQVAMVHCNNCTSDLNAWVGIFREFSEAFGIEVDMNKLFGTLYNKALEGDADCGGLLAYNYFSGEHITGFNEGRPLFVRKPDSKFNLANFMRVNLFTSLGALKVGFDILLKNEDVKIDKIYGHGGLFKTKGVGQGILAAALNSPVSVMETAGEGGAWGIALLASYMVNKADGETLDQFLADKVFGGSAGSEMQPNPADVAGFDAFIERYKAGLPIERAAVEALR